MSIKTTIFNLLYVIHAFHGTLLYLYVALLLLSLFAIYYLLFAMKKFKKQEVEVEVEVSAELWTTSNYEVVGCLSS